MKLWVVLITGAVVAAAPLAPSKRADPPLALVQLTPPLSVAGLPTPEASAAWVVLPSFNGQKAVGLVLSVRTLCEVRLPMSS